VDQKIVILVTPDFANPSITFDEIEHIVLDSTKVITDLKRQITRQTIVWDKANPTEGDDVKNYRKSFQVIDGIVEGDADISLTAEGKTLKSDWLVNSVEDNQLATSFAQREVNRFSTIPLVADFTIDQRYVGNVAGGRIWLGSVFGLDSSRVVDGGLNKITKTCQCISIKPSRKDGMWDVKGLSYVTASPATADLFITTDKIDYLLTDELTTTEAREYVVVINSGVTISSSTTGFLAFTQGVFFAGATLKLFNLGQVVGAGGKGGDGGNGTASGVSCVDNPGNDGLTGGDAMSFSTDVVIDNGFGLIFGGGGGGAGSDSVCAEEQGPVFSSTSGSGGGGGRGFVGGLKGLKGIGSDDAIDGLDGTDGCFGAFGLGGDDDGTSADGGDGGDFGESGNNATGKTGGAAGDAILKNGNAVTFTSGNNTEQVKGLII